MTVPSPSADVVPVKAELEEIAGEAGDTPKLHDPRSQCAATLHDGYKWRKYGQKSLKTTDGSVDIIKSYYRCNMPGCPMRKQVEKYAKDDQVRVVHFIGTFHNHPPCADNPLRMTSRWAEDASNDSNATLAVSDGWSSVHANGAPKVVAEATQ